MSKVTNINIEGQAPIPTEANQVADSTLFMTLTVAQAKELLRQVLREERERKGWQGGHETGDRLIDRDEAERVLAVSRDWLYRYGNKLGLARKVRGKVNYSWLAIQNYIKTRKIS